MGSRGKKYFRCLCRLDGSDFNLIWYSDDTDGVVVDGPKVVGFRSVKGFEEYSRAVDLAIEDEAPMLHDFDQLIRWSADHESNPVDCDLLLSAENLLSDILSSIGGEPSLSSALDADTTYEKLFRGCNLPSIGGPQYTPLWTASELKRLAKRMEVRILAFRSALVLVDGKG